MSKRELDRVPVIANLVNKRIRVADAAKLLNLESRQIGRLKLRYQKFGATGLIHKSRGRPSHNKLKEKISNKTTKLLKENYPDFWPTHATDWRP